MGHSLLKRLQRDCTAMAVAAGFIVAPSLAQDPDLFDDSLLRQIDITIYDAAGNVDSAFWSKLVQNWNSGAGANLPADLTISGPDLATPETRTGVGIRIKGNSSFFFLPAGSRKASFNIEIDDQDPDLDLWGYQTLNLNNGIEDPTFCREVSFFRFIREYTPAGLGNHVVVTINGEPWGVYASLQQYNKRLLEESFADGGGVRIKCPNFGGAALRYLGAAINQYFNDYELKNDGGLGTTAAWQTLVDACDALNNTPISQPDVIDEGLAMDAAIWSVAVENLFMDEDSYISKGADFNVYWDPVHQRSHLHQHDGNETWGVSLFGWPGGATSTLSPTYNFTSNQRPVLRRIAQIPKWRERYMAHMRTLLQDFEWSKLEPQLLGYRDVIDAAVQADPKKLYTYQQFQQNFFTDTSVNVGGAPVTAPGLQRFVDERRAFLLAHPEIDEPVPSIAWARHSPYRPQPGQTIQVSARIQPAAGTTVGEAILYYRHGTGRFVETPLLDDGMNGDGAPGDGIYGAALPVSLSSGELIEYYVSASSDAPSGSGMTFLPRHAEGRPLDVRVGFGSSGIRITEVLYSGSDDEFFELINSSSAPIDMNGWSMDDSSADPGVLDLSAAGVLAPGEVLVVTEADETAFRAAWGLTGGKVIGGVSGASLGRNDTVHIFDASGALHERLAYGDERYEYSARAKDESAWVCAAGLGLDDPYSWRSSDSGDAQGSIVSAGGDSGSPGRHATVTCDPLAFGDPYCAPVANSTGATGELRAIGSPVVGANSFGLMATELPANQFGLFICSRTQGSVMNPGGSQGVLCLSGSIGRIMSTLGMSDATGRLDGAVNLLGLPSGSGSAAAMPGESWNFQLWHRDLNPTPTSNFTEGLEVMFQ